MDHKIAVLAERQHGVVVRSQLLGLGLGRGALDHRVARGRLHRIHTGVYAVGHRRLTERGHWMAAVLACGPGAMLSHRSAAVLWGLQPSARAVVDVSVPGRSRRRRAGIDVHRPRGLAGEGCRRRDGIPLTSVERTLLDLAGTMAPARVERCLDEALRLRLLDAGAAVALIQRTHGHRGAHVLQAMLGRAEDDPAPTRSELERRFLELCATGGLPRPAVNVVVAGLEVDALWPDRRLVVELDGYRFHHTRAAFERDRIRDTTLQVSGYRVARFTHRRLATKPQSVLRTIRSLLAAPPPVPTAPHRPHPGP